MSELYKADASNFTREQLVELINIQTNLQLEANKTIVIAKGKIEELEHKLELEHSRIKNLEKQNARIRECLCRIIEFESRKNHFMTYVGSVAIKTLKELDEE